MSMQNLPLFDQTPPQTKEVESSSKEVYAVLNESGKRISDELKVLRALGDYGAFHSPASPTARELHAWMLETGRCGVDPNEVKPRLTELEEAGDVAKCAESEKRHCTVGQRKVRVFTWSITSQGQRRIKAQ